MPPSSLSPSSSSWSWKHRLYAFLLRRALGPFLTPQSASDLHRSIQAVDWTDGRFVLVDVELDPVHLTSLIRGSGDEDDKEDKEDEEREHYSGNYSGDVDNSTKSSNSNSNTPVNTVNVAVKFARVRRFAIQLSLRELDSGTKPRGEERSAARKATSALLRSVFGTTDSGKDGGGDGEGSDASGGNGRGGGGGGGGSGGGVGGIALVAHVELEGLDVVLSPGDGSVDPSKSMPTSSHRSQHPLHASSSSRDAITSNMTSTLPKHSASASNQQNREKEVAAPGFFSSLVDSALKSLRLSIDISDVNIRVFSREICSEAKASSCWVGLHLASARYYDLIESNDGKTQRAANKSTKSNVLNRQSTDAKRNSDLGKIYNSNGHHEKMVLSKALDWEGLTIKTGQSKRGKDGFDMQSFLKVTENSPKRSHQIVKTCGAGNVRFSVFEKWSDEGMQDTKQQRLTVTKQIGLSFDQGIAVEVGLNSLTHLAEITSAMAASDNTSLNSVDVDENNISHPLFRNSDLGTASSTKSTSEIVADSHRETYDQIMKQYTEARHLARTRELRGGILLPSFDEYDGSNDNFGGEVSFDAFFDANDHSVNYYCSIMEESVDGGDEKRSEKVDHGSLSQTNIDFGIPELTVKVHLREEPFSTGDNSRDDLLSEYMLMSLGDFKVIFFGYRGESTVNCSIHHFEIESQLSGSYDWSSGQYSPTSESFLRFTGDSDDGGLVVSSPPCISIQVDFTEDNHKQCRVDVILQPLEIIHQKRLVVGLSKLVNRLRPPKVSTSEEAQQTQLLDLQLSVSCGSVILIVPCEQPTKPVSKGKTINPLFRRCGYRERESHSNQFLGLGLEIDNISANFSKKTTADHAISVNSEESKAGVKFSHVIFFAKSTELEQVRRSRKFASYVTRRVDLMGFTGDEGRESDAFVMVSFSQTKRQKNADENQSCQPLKRRSAFPVVLPLSSMKARQEVDESGDIEDMYDEVFKSASGDQARFETSNVTSSGPQCILLSEANEAGKELVVNIPVIFFDVTVNERQELSRILSIVTDTGASQEDDCRKNESLTTQSDKQMMGLLVSVGQIAVVFHGSQPGISSASLDKPDHMPSYSFIMDKMQVHTLISPAGVRNVRFLSHDVTLYELSHLHWSTNLDVATRRLVSCADRFKLLKERFIANPPTMARVVFFRSKLCQPLSPETPAMLVDVMLRKESNGLSNVPTDDCGECIIHVNIYDMTYRYVMNSEWIQNCMSLIKGEANIPNKHSEESLPQQSASPQKANSEESSSLINLFVNLTDCNFDYTPPMTFRRDSRVILRFGEVRLTSNIVTPSVRVQAYKVSLADLAVHLCNYRHQHNEENSLLSCAQRYLNSDDLVIRSKSRCLANQNAIALEDALCRMDFVNVAILDTLDAIILSVKNDEDRREGIHSKDPSVTVALTLGMLSLHACQDSFSCLTETYNEWFVKFTALSQEMLEKLRASSESRSKIGAGTEIAFAKNEYLLPHTQHERDPPFDRKQHTVHNFSNAPAPMKHHASPGQVKAHRSTTPSAGHPSDNVSGRKNLHRDDAVSLDLTKSLLFQNFYTFNATTHHQQVNKPKSPKSVARKMQDRNNFPSSYSDDEWIAVEHDFLRHSSMPRDKDQTAKWTFLDANGNSANKVERANISSHEDIVNDTQSQKIKVFPQHIPVKPILDPLAGGKIDTAKLAGTHKAPKIDVRVIVKDASMVCRLYDGFDWVSDLPQFHLKPKRSRDRRKELLNNLIDENDAPSGGALKCIPLPEERNEKLRRDSARRKLCRNAYRYFQISISGLKLRQDSFAESREHHLASCLDLSVSDFFIAETISDHAPIKMLGEWVNEREHPRDNSDGVIMLKMVTKHPTLRVSADGKLMSDESRATLELLPLRCYISQIAMRFIRNFFSGKSAESERPDSDDGTNDYDDLSDEELINVFFQSFKCLPCKLKVDYRPERMDVESFRDGNYVEILNLCPLEEMVLTLQAVENHYLSGWGSVFSELAGRWIEDICATQAHKFFTRATPVQFFSNVGDGVADLVVIPLDLLYSEGNSTDYLKSVLDGTTTFAGKVAFEALSTSAKITQFAAKQLNSKALPSAGLTSSLPSRPKSIPRHAGDAAGHAYESIARGLREANYKIVTIPCREYQQHGASGAARSAVRGIPIAVLAPLSGASEALSYTLLGLRNQLRPDLRKEEEASLRGLNYDM